MTRLTLRTFLLLLLTAACAPRRTPQQLALIAAADCKALLLAADAARADHDKRLARELAMACPQAGLDRLVSQAEAPAEAFLWCGRARAALVERSSLPSCPAARVVDLTAELKPRLTLGPADPEAAPDLLLKAALAKVGPELNLGYDHGDPMVYVGLVRVSVEKSETETIAKAPDPTGKGRNVPATLHRLQVRAEAQAELGTRTRTIHATEEARDTTWQAEPRYSIAARFTPQIGSEDELRRNAVIGLVRNLARALRQSPPETLEPTDAQGCLAYGLALAVATGDRTAAVSGMGDPNKVETCEKLLGLPKCAGIPVP